MLADATHDLSCERGSSNAVPGSKRCCPSGCARKRFRGVSSEGDSLVEDTPFQAALRTALSDRNDSSAEFFNSLLNQVLMPDAKPPLTLFSIVIPARDEEASLPSTLRGLHATFATENIPHEIVAVDDGSR